VSVKHIFPSERKPPFERKKRVIGGGERGMGKGTDSMKVGVAHEKEKKGR